MVTLTPQHFKVIADLCRRTGYGTDRVLCVAAEPHKRSAECSEDVTVADAIEQAGQMVAGLTTIPYTDQELQEMTRLFVREAQYRQTPTALYALLVKVRAGKPCSPELTEPA